MLRQGRVFRTGLVNDLESRLNSSTEALKTAVDAKERLDTNRTNRVLKAKALQAAAAAKNAYVNLDEPINEILESQNLLKLGAGNRYSEIFGRYFLSNTIGGAAAKILYDILGTLFNGCSRVQFMVADEKNLIAEIDKRSPHRYYQSVREAAIKLSSAEKFSSVVKVLQYVSDKYPVPILQTS